MESVSNALWVVKLVMLGRTVRSALRDTLGCLGGVKGDAQRGASYSTESVISAKIVRTVYRTQSVLSVQTIRCSSMGNVCRVVQARHTLWMECARSVVQTVKDVWTNRSV